jgi:hypothetical protein
MSEGDPADIELPDRTIVDTVVAYSWYFSPNVDEITEIGKATAKTPTSTVTYPTIAPAEEFGTMSPYLRAPPQICEWCDQSCNRPVQYTLSGRSYPTVVMDTTVHHPACIKL